MKKTFCFIALLLVVGLGVFYWQKMPRLQYVKMPVHYVSDSIIPCIEIEIESQKYLVQLDSGSQDGYTVPKEILDIFKNKKENGWSTFKDICNNNYDLPSFIIPELKISHMRLYPVVLTQEDPQFFRNTYISSDASDIPQESKNIQGRLGMLGLKKTCLVIDLPHSFIYFAKDFSVLEKKLGFSLAGFVEAPLVSAPENCIFSFHTNVGEKRFLIDTGAEGSFWHNADASRKFARVPINLLFDNSKTISYKFITFNLDPFGVDGILGADFLKKHVTVLDLPNKKVYIGPEEL